MEVHVVDGKAPRVLFAGTVTMCTIGAHKEAQRLWDRRTDNRDGRSRNLLRSRDQYQGNRSAIHPAQSPYRRDVGYAEKLRGDKREAKTNCRTGKGENSGAVQLSKNGGIMTSHAAAEGTGFPFFDEY